MTIYTAVITLILVMDPIGNVPVFLSILNRVEPERRVRIILRETLIALVVLTCFLFFGQYILQGMDISAPALSIAGGIVLFLIAIRMIFPNNSHVSNTYPEHLGEPFIVPLAVPLVAGPSTMAIVMLMASQHPEQLWHWQLALLIAWFISTVILLMSETLRKLLGPRGLTALERLMGMILTTMSVQMFLSGIDHFFRLHP